MIVPEDKSVDAILGLGLIDNQNVAILRTYIPQMEDAMFNLAHLLYLTRVGFSGMDEVAIKNAMDLLDRVTGDLRSIFTTEDMVNNLSE